MYSLEADEMFVTSTPPCVVVLVSMERKLLAVTLTPSPISTYIQAETHNIRTHARTDGRTHVRAHSLTHARTHSRTHSLTHSLTH